MSMTKFPKSRAQHLHKVIKRVLKIILGNTFLTGWPAHVTSMSVKLALKKKSACDQQPPLLRVSYSYAHIQLHLPVKVLLHDTNMMEIGFTFSWEFCWSASIQKHSYIVDYFREMQIQMMACWLSAVVVKALFVKPRDIAWLWIDQPMQSIPHPDPGTKCQKLLLDPFDYIPSFTCTNLGWR